MASLEEIFENACTTREIPGAVLMAKDASGKFSYSKAFGKRSLKNSSANPSGEDPPMALDTVMWIASCTKLLTATAALQCVERGLLDLDSDVGDVWPPLMNMDILKGWDDKGKPIFEKAKEVVTLRRLLCHCSGVGYDAVAPELIRWRASRNEHPNDGIRHLGPKVIDRYLVPLIYEPGTSWIYGGGMDLVGKLIEAANPSHKNLASYFEANIFQPLGIKDLTFFLNERPDMLARFADLSIRDPEGSGKVVDGSAQSFNGYVEDAFAGSGLFGTAEEYIKVLESILKDDGKLLKSETRELLFTPQFETGSGPVQALMTTLSDPLFNGPWGGGTPFGTHRNWGLGGILMEEDAPGNCRSKGTLSWSGLPNLHWFIDRTKGLCGIYASQVFPTGEDKSYEMFQVFEKAMFERSRNALL